MELEIGDLITLEPTKANSLYKGGSIVYYFLWTNKNIY